MIALYAQHRPDPPGCYHAVPLVKFFGQNTLAQINGQRCREYIEARGREVSLSTVRRELGTFQAAINLWHVESPLDAVPTVQKPEEGERRDRVLTRSEAARLLAAARRLKRPDIARFILIALYTGTRHDAILRLRWYESADAGWIDWQKGILHRAGSAERKTRKKRAASRIPDVLMAHVRRWARLDLSRGPQAAVIRYKGQPMMKLKRNWENVVKAAGLGDDVTPHVLKHTCATWLLDSGMELWDVSGLTSTSMKTLEATYGHHMPEFQAKSAKAFRRRG